MAGGYFFVKQMQDSIRSNQRLLERRASLQTDSTSSFKNREAKSSDYEALKKWKIGHRMDRIKETAKTTTIIVIVSIIVAAVFGYFW